jgi:predicted transcriptional regulator
MAATTSVRIFGDLEREIMTILWRDGHGTVRSVWQQIRQARPIAYTTVMTSMVRLAGKDVLNARAPGPIHGPRGYVYTPAVTRSALMHAAVATIWDELGATEAERRQLLEALHG